jgi:hypothetical protein
MTPSLHTTEQAAQRLGIHPGHLRRLALSLGIGQKLSERVRVFTDEDIERLRVRETRPGRKTRKDGTR